MNDLEEIAEQILVEFSELDQARNDAYTRSRSLTSLAAKTIRAIHREEWETADQLLLEAKEAVDILVTGTKGYPQLYWAGYTQDSIKEYVEAHLTYQLVRGEESLATPEQLQVESRTWLNGLAEAATELRRRILDIMRHGYSDEAERLLEKMDDIYSVLVTFDFNDNITGGLRRRTDTVRAVLERTRGDLTISLRRSKLQDALQAFEKRVFLKHDE